MITYIIASVLIIVGLLATAYKGTLPAAHWQMPYLNELSSALLVGGLLSLLFRLFHDKQSDVTLRRLLRIHDSVDELGLVQIIPQHQAYDFTGLIESAENLTIVMNDGLRWVGNYSVALQTRFGRKGCTEIFTVDPDSPFVQCLANKTSLSVDDKRKKIRDSWKKLEDAYINSAKNGQLIIYRLKTYPTRSIFLTESQLIETPYQSASGRINIPAFVYRKVADPNSLYAFAKHDIEELRKESKVEREYKP